MSVVRFSPWKKSPISVMLMLDNPLAPIPSIKSKASSELKFFINEQAKPAIPKMKSDGINTVFRPSLSAKIPVSGVKNIPGRVNAVISRPTCLGEIPKYFMIPGKAGVMLEIPITAMSVTPKMIIILLSDFIIFTRTDFLLAKYEGSKQFCYLSRALGMFWLHYFS